MGDLTLLSEELHRDASALLAESALLELLAPYGQVLPTGSYQYRLMAVPDIDLCIVHPQIGRMQAGEIVSTLIDQGFWRGVAYEDFLQFPREDLPAGIYLGLKRSFRGRFWKVDLWCLTDATRDLAVHEALAHLTEEQRRTILQIKQWRREANELSMPSMLIYEAVLRGKAHDVSSFLRVLEAYKCDL
ncbi:MAG TPA: hypothetical protein PLZ36_11045 [Armatimonadota bacterium]|nr:hypothetical protein [Armatimonadota bacterium]